MGLVASFVAEKADVNGSVDVGMSAAAFDKTAALEDV